MKTDLQIIVCQNCGAKNRAALSADKQAVCGKCKTPLVISALPVTITDANFAEEVGKSKLPVLVDFWAIWCPPCKMIAPTIDALAKELVGKVKIGKLDVDQNPILSSRFHVQSIPTLIIFKDGKEVDRLIGANSKEAMLNRLRVFMK
jgi:thioredoxin 2